ncbi:MULTISPECIES: spermidine synthase [Streptomycetaceae]|uniref:spermidine synthase n=1 Tax=Streptomycetaceae TaxID=2062 RepID=UPI00300B5B38
MSATNTEEPVVLDRRDGPYGEAVLRRRGPHLEIIANGTFLMDTSDGRSERLLVDAALAALPPGRDGASVLIGGLGVGFSLAHAAAQPRWARIDVVERERAVIDWHRAGHFAAHTGGALDDPRVRLVEADLLAYLRTAPGPAAAPAAGPERGYDALCLDIDNGPDWTVTDNNGSLYSPSGLDDCRELLRPGGVLAVWSAQPSAAFEAALTGAGYSGVRTLEVPVARGVPDVVHVAVKA